jgi:hypothetical protein
VPRIQNQASAFRSGFLPEAVVLFNNPEEVKVLISGPVSRFISGSSDEIGQWV